MRSVFMLVCLCGLAIPAHAEPGHTGSGSGEGHTGDAGHAPASEADRLFLEGRALSKEGKLTEACERYEQSFTLDHATGTQLNIADCREQEGHLRQAWELYTAAAEAYQRSGNTVRSRFAQDHADAVAAKLATVVVHVPLPLPRGFAVTISGRVVQPSGEIRELVDAGPVEITAAAPGRAGYVTSGAAVAGGTLEVAVPALAEQVVAAVPTERRRSRVVAAWILTGAAGAAGIAAGVISLVATSNYNSVASGPNCFSGDDGLRCNGIGQSELNRANRLSNYGVGVGIGAGALLVAAGIVYFTAPRDQVTVTPTANAHGAGAALTWRF